MQRNLEYLMWERPLKPTKGGAARSAIWPPCFCPSRRCSLLPQLSYNFFMIIRDCSMSSDDCYIQRVQGMVQGAPLIFVRIFGTGIIENS